MQNNTFVGVLLGSLNTARSNVFFPFIATAISVGDGSKFSSVLDDSSPVPFLETHDTLETGSTQLKEHSNYRYSPYGTSIVVCHVLSDVSGTVPGDPMLSQSPCCVR